MTTRDPRALARRAVRGAEEILLRRLERRLHPWEPYSVRLSYPPSAEVRPRYGYGRPQHRRIAAALATHHETYRSELGTFLEFSDALRRIAAREPDPGEPCWVNAWLPGLDTVTLYSYLRRTKPARYVEVGSGNSTAVVHQARRDGGLATKIISIDPNPRRDIDVLCDRVIRTPLEAAGMSPFDDLEAGDVVFFDGSHRVFTNSDVVAFYLDVLPELPAGVLVGVHDILWPDDYLPEWNGYWFSEQYLMGAYLLAEVPWMAPRLACNYAAQQHDLAAVTQPIFDQLGIADLDRRGFGFWFEKLEAPPVPSPAT